MAISRFLDSSIQDGIPKYDSIWDGTTAVGSMEAISGIVLPSAQSVVEFNNIPQTYSHLQIRYIARTNRVDVQDLIRFRFNADSGTNYAYHWIRGDGSVADTSYATSTASPWTGICAGNNASANQFGAGLVDIFDYSNINKNTTTRTLSAVDTNSTDCRIMFLSTLWINTSAVNSIQIAPNYGTAFNQYSSFSLYGVK